MNYIELINQFWRTRRSKRITSTQADLYFCLVQESNERAWENPFEFPNGQLCARIGISEPTMIDARARLKQVGLISFEAGERKAKSPVYYLNILSTPPSKHRANTEQNLGQKPTKTGNLLNKPNKTKEENIPLPLSGISERLELGPEHENTNQVKTPQKEKEKSCAKKEKDEPMELAYPHNSKAFMQAWSQLSAMPKWARKATSALQLTLNKLGRYEETFAIGLMERAIMGDYQGVVFSNTDADYDKWKVARTVAGNETKGKKSVLQSINELFDDENEPVANTAVTELDCFTEVG